MPWTSIRSGRDAVTAGFFCRSDPAAALRGFANGALPASTRLSFSASKPATGKNTSPRTSSTAGSVPRQAVRDAVEREDVGRDVLPHPPVAAGGRDGLSRPSR